MNGLFNPTKDRFDIFREWLHDLGGTYEFFRPDPEPKPGVYEPAHQPNPRPLNPDHYYVDAHGAFRRRRPKRK